MQVSIKLVVGVLLFVVVAFTMVVAHLPALVQLQHDALDLAVDQSTSSVELVQDVLQRKLWLVERSCRDLYRAAKTQNIVQELDSVLNWIGTAVSEQQIGGGLFVSGGTGVYVDDHITPLASVIGGNIPGYVYVVNLTHPTQHFDIGLFQLVTGAPIYPQVPWYTVPTTLSWIDFPGSADIQDPNRTTPLQWSRLLPFNAQLATFASTSPTDSAIFFGGPLDSVSEQHVFFMLRGSWLSNYFANNVSVSATGVAVLLDSYSGAFVAGNINDPTGIAVPNGTALMPATQLGDSRIAPILSAGSSWTYESGVAAVMTCPPPCTFIFWPHKNQLQVVDGTYGHVFDIILHHFTVVRVAEVHHDAGSKLDLRLVITIPSQDIVGAFVNGLRFSFIVPFFCMMVVCIALVVGIALSFRGLTEVEHEMQRMMTIFVPSRSSISAAPTVMSSEATRAMQHTVITEFHRIFLAVRLLSRQLHTLRAFSTASTSYRCSISTAADASQTDSVAMRTDYGEEGVPYAFRSRKLWSVPVTTVAVLLRSDFIGGLRDDPVAVFARYSAVHGVFQRELSHIAGASMDTFSGDNFLLHFNAAGRTSNHALVAVSFIHRCLQAVELMYESPLWAPDQFSAAHQHQQQHHHTETTTPLPATPLPPRKPPLYFGVASMLSLCGSMGPVTFRSFTVVSSGEPQAVMMCRIAEKKHLPLSMTWRAVDLVRQQMLKISINPHHLSHHPYQQAAVAAMLTNGRNNNNASSVVNSLFEFFPISQVILPGEAQRQVSMAYAPAW
ncbi:membrane-associated protein, putative [Bodo saltans]|uniref:Membrane-associated protein, putative n=1 Tax=Bodo saltans TaxID=75058 RepID=A0A0S4IMS7_BODSA|nr:membrane-associated protein, putative [Bodo saltans]|eukprot:CUE74698.1 membrane-associated protein, putative [Bodo saltans]